MRRSDTTRQKASSRSKAARRSAPHPLAAWPHFAADEIEAVGPCSLGQGQLLDRRANAASSSRSSPTGPAPRMRWRSPTARWRSSSRSRRSASARATRSSSRRAPSSPRVALRRQRRRDAGVRRRRPRQRQHHGGDHRAGSSRRARGPSSACTSPAGRATWTRSWRSDEHGLKVIEDCAQAHGATLQGPAGRALGHVGAWSFCQDKIMTTGGEGGMLTTDDEASVARHAGLQGPRQELRRGVRAPAPARLPLAARELRHQLAHDRDAGGHRPHPAARHGRLDRAPHAPCRSDPAACARGIAAACACRARPRTCVHAHYKCYVYVQPRAACAGWSRDRIVAAINAQGVPAIRARAPRSICEKAFDGRLAAGERLPVARELGETSLMFLVHPTLTDAESPRPAQRRAT